MFAEYPGKERFAKTNRGLLRYTTAFPMLMRRVVDTAGTLHSIYGLRIVVFDQDT